MLGTTVWIVRVYQRDILPELTNLMATNIHRDISPLKNETLIREYSCSGHKLDCFVHSLQTIFVGDVWYSLCDRPWWAFVYSSKTVELPQTQCFHPLWIYHMHSNWWETDPQQTWINCASISASLVVRSNCHKLDPWHLLRAWIVGTTHDWERMAP